MGLTGMSGALFAGLTVLLTGVLALLHFLRIRPRKVRVVTTLFWDEAAQEVRARSLFERFRHVPTFLLLLGIALLILLSLAKPVRDAASRPYRVIVLEAGLAMTVDDGRFETALERVRAEAGAHDEERTAVVVADPHPRVLKHFNENRAVLTGRLGAIQPVQMPVQRVDGLSTARSLLEGRAGETVLVTPAPLELEDADIRVLVAGPRPPNACVLSAAFVPGGADGSQGELHWRVGYTGRAEGIVETAARRDGQTLAEETVRLQPGEVRALVVSGVQADGGVVTLSVAGDDTIAGDNRVDYRLPDHRRIRVRAAGGEALPETFKALCKALPELATEVTDGPAMPEVVVGPPRSGARIVVRPSGATGELAPVVAGDHPLVTGLVFEDALCRIPEQPLTLSGDMIPLLLAGGVPVAVLDTATDQVIVAESVIDEQASIARRSGTAVFWSRVLHHFAGWRDEPLTLSPQQARRAIYDGDERLVMKASLAELAASQSEEPVVDARPGFRLPLWQLVLGGALLLCVVEGVLHVQGRIA